MSWVEAIALNRALIAKGQTDLNVIVSGSAIDGGFWANSVESVKRDTLREDGKVQIVSLAEKQPLGNFLGTINAWMGLNRALSSPPSNGVGLLNMVFGKGKRFSPFTQAMGNRKAAFPTPLRARHSDAYLRTGDLATLYSNSWLDQLRSRGFNGLLIKWGDEAVVPSLSWSAVGHDFSDVDLVRCVWKTEPTEVLAREKEWFVINDESGLIERMIPRQDLASLSAELHTYQGRRISTAVNLGSIAVSYRFLSLAAQVFGDVLDGRRLSADWDPYAIVLLLAPEGSPEARGVSESPIVQAGLRQAEARCPGLLAKMKELRARVLQTMGRPLRMGFLDFGEAFWIDLGLHTTLRRCLDALTEDDPVGRATRAFFDIPDARDANGNIVVDSTLPPGAKIKDSVIVNSTILDPDSVVTRGVVVGARHNRLAMPSGGTSLFSAVRDLQFDGDHGVAFRSIADVLHVPQGGRHTSLFLDGKAISMLSNESVKSYDDSEYSQPILGNPLSFEEAGNLVGAVDPQRLEETWKAAWKGQAIEP
jgi:hypothetical protein